MSVLFDFRAINILALKWMVVLTLITEYVIIKAQSEFNKKALKGIKWLPETVGMITINFLKKSAGF